MDKNESNIRIKPRFAFIKFRPRFFIHPLHRKNERKNEAKSHINGYPYFKSSLNAIMITVYGKAYVFSQNSFPLALCNYFKICV